MKSLAVGALFLVAASLTLCACDSENADSTGPVERVPLIADPEVLQRVRDELGPIPLTGVAVEARVAGSLAEVTVEQTFENNLAQRIEAVYVFPLPDDAAVHEMVMIIGERRISADLRERAEARQAYEQARAAGQTASLLEQERPNIFTMSVANIQPGEPVRVVVRYVEELPYRDGRYQFHFPTTVGPRFVPGEPTGQQGTGMLADTTQVPDASRITPAVLPEGVPTPYQVSFRLELEAGLEILEPRSTSHDLLLGRRDERHLSVSLRPEDRQPNRDIEFSYALASDGPAFGMLTHYDRERGGYFSLMFEPPATFDDDDVRPKEMVFVLDTSGSMTGYPVETSKAVVRYALAHMNPEDTFQIIRFGDSASNLSPTPLPNTAENVARGLSFVDAMAGGGGTMMTAGIHAALGPPPDPDRMRIVLFLTDGFIGNETEILALIDQEVGQSRLFSLGVGSSVNRFLLDRMAERGRGVVHYVNLGEQPDAVVEAFYSRFRNPILTDVTVDFHGFQVEGLQPDQELIPDVFAGTPIQLTGRYRQGGATEATIRGRLGTRPVSYELDLRFPSEGSDRPAIANLWARRHIEAIEARYAHQQGAARNEVLPLALEYGLLTQYTAFVAIEERINPDARDPLRTVGVPVALPAGMTDVNVGPQVLSLPGAGRSEGSSMAGASPVMPSSAAPTQMQAEEAPMFAALDRAREASQMPAGISPAGHATATIDSVTIGGALQREPVTSTLRLHTVVLQQCYQSRLDLQPGLRGSIILSFVVDPSGAVSQARIVGSTLGDEALNLCVVRSLASLRFSSPSDGSPATITVSIAFRPV